MEEGKKKKKGDKNITETKANKINGREKSKEEKS